MKKSLGARPLVYPTPVFIVGSFNQDEKPNAMSVSWGGIVCSKPPCVSISLRQATYSYGNIVNRKAFTVSIPSEEHIREADYFGIASGRNENKFEVAKLTAVKSSLVDAPYVQEFPLVLECRVIHVLEIGLHTLFVGEILDVKADEEVLNPKGLPEIEKVKPCLFAPENQNYYGIGRNLGQAFSIGKKL